jgi:protein SCO1/2
VVRLRFHPKDPTPPVLKKHAATLGADPKVWTFLTGDLKTIDKFASRFGVSVVRGVKDERDITHNLRTALIDRAGNLVKIYTGNEWTPSEIMADIKVLVGVD